MVAGGAQLRCLHAERLGPELGGEGDQRGSDGAAAALKHAEEQR